MEAEKKKDIQNSSDPVNEFINDHTYIASPEISTRLNMEKALKESEAQFRMLAEESPNMIFINQRGKVLYCNKKCEEITGYAKEEILSPSFDFHVLHTPDSMDVVMAAFQKHMKGEEVAPYEYRLKTKSGKVLEAIITTKLIDYQGGKSIMGIVTDISKQKAVEQALRNSEQTYRVTINSLGDAIHMIDRDMRIVLFNRTLLEWQKRYNLMTNILGKKITEVYPFLGKQVLEQYERVFSTGETFVTEESNQVGRQTIYTETRKIPVFENGKVNEIITVMRDISGTKEKEQKLRDLNQELVDSNKRLKELSLLDAHTGLYNHRYLGEVLKAEFARAKREDTPLALLKVDVDYFKSINDLYGHEFGDIVLKQLALHLKKLVRKYNIVTRYGGEEFVILSPNTDRLEAINVGQRLIDAINVETFGTKANSVKLRISVAVAAYPEDKIIKAIDMIEMADQCINKAKELGGNRLCTSQELMEKKKPEKKHKADRADIRQMKDKIDKLTKRANQSLIESIFAFAKTIELKDHYTGEHVEKTVQFATDIAKAVGLPREQINLIKQAAILHDLGKVGIPEKILHKKAKLTKKEFKEIKAHPLIGADIIRPIHLLHDILPYIMYHHERWDGKGYPIGLKGEEIPLGARIISLADTYQALTSNRPYRKAFSKSEAIKMIKECAGTQFDPAMVNAFLKIIKKGS